MSEPTLIQMLKGEPRHARRWEVLGKYWFNEFCCFFGLCGPFTITKQDVRRPPRKWQKLTEMPFRWFGREIRRTPTFIGLVIFSLLAVLAWYLGWPGGDNVLTEFYGLLMDVLVILVFFQFFMGKWEKRQEVKRHQDLIDDFKRWDSDEARVRILGAARRLAKMGITAIDFSSAKLSNIRWNAQGIRSLAGSKFYSGNGWHPPEDEGVELTNVDFSLVDCSGVIFSKRHPWGGTKLQKHQSYCKLSDCDFRSTTLTGASFRGAKLVWSVPPPQDQWETVEDRTTGEQHHIRTSVGQFDGTSLENVNFDGVAFENADFRGCFEIEKASFKGATGLDQAIFDSEDEKDAVLGRVASEDAP